MRLSRVLALLGVVAGVALWAGFLPGRGRPSEVRHAEAPSRPEKAPSLGPAPVELERIVMPSSASRALPADPRGPADSVDPEQGLAQAEEPAEEWLMRGPMTRDPTPLDVFEAQYGGESLEELERSFEQVVERMREERSRLFQERYDAGLFELRAYPEDGSMLRLEHGGGPAVRVINEATDPVYARVVYLPFDEYPEFYEIQDEWTYLSWKINTLKGKVYSIVQDD